MKRIGLLLALVFIVSIASTINGQSFVRWNKSVGIGVGYTNMFQEFTSQYEDISAPQDLVHFDFTIYGVYVGFDTMVKDTGYEVYGYNEKLATWIFKVDPSFRIGRTKNWRYTLTPYIGAAFYTLSDSSNNDIGARDEYGTKETKFLGGYRVTAAYDWYYIGFHFSTRELGVTLGVDFTL